MTADIAVTGITLTPSSHNNGQQSVPSSCCSCELEQGTSAQNPVVTRIVAVPYPIIHMAGFHFLLFLWQGCFSCYFCGRVAFPVSPMAGFLFLLFLWQDSFSCCSCEPEKGARALFLLFLWLGSFACYSYGKVPLPIIPMAGFLFLLFLWQGWS